MNPMTSHTSSIGIGNTQKRQRADKGLSNVIPGDNRFMGFFQISLRQAVGPQSQLQKHVWTSQRWVSEGLSPF